MNPPGMVDKKKSGGSESVVIFLQLNPMEIRVGVPSQQRGSRTRYPYSRAGGEIAREIVSVKKQKLRALSSRRFAACRETFVHYMAFLQVIELISSCDSLRNLPQTHLPRTHGAQVNGQCCWLDLTRMIFA